MAQSLPSVAGPALPTMPNEEDMVAILTKTIIPSPVIRWILHARIRSNRCNDVVFVGEDYIHVKQVKDDGTIQHIATKNDFDGQITAANVFNNREEDANEDLFPKVVNGELDGGKDNVPPQCLVLTLSRNDLVFIWLAICDDHSFRFVQQSCPLPTFDKPLYQPGQHLAVDPQSRAVAVAAREREVVLYTAKSKDRIQYELRDKRSNWCPVSAQRPLQIPGTIQHMDFLIPPVDDQGRENKDYIILLLIIVDEGKTRAIRIEWQASSDLHHARIHPAQPLDVKRTVPSLLVPLRNASFLLVHGSEIKLWRNILTGSATSRVLELDANEPNDPGASPRYPLWTNWCRPIRGQLAKKDTDHLYLIREDGQLYLLQITPDGIDLSNAGAFGCHVSSACASLGDSLSPDIIVVAGDMSSGSIKSIGKWFTPKEVPQVSREDWLEMNHIETIPNWASNTDLALSSLSGRSQRSRDGMFVTSGRQPYGVITELRYGVEAGIYEYVESDIMKSVTDIWALPCPAVGNTLTLLSSPGGTRIFDSEYAESNGDEVSLETDYVTLAAGPLGEGKIVQITERTIRISLGTPTNFEDCACFEVGSGISISAATIDFSRKVVIAATRSTDEDNPFSLHCYLLKVDDPDVSGDEQIISCGTIALDKEVLCVSNLQNTASHLIALVATADGELKAFSVNLHGTIEELASTTMPQSADGPGICDRMVVLQSNGMALVVCGLRDGRIFTIVVGEDTSSLFGRSHVIPFGQTTVKLVQPPQEQAFAFAISGLETCLLDWNGQGADALRIQNIWFTDKDRPELSQSMILACTAMPPADQFSGSSPGYSFIAVAGEELRIATLNTSSRVVPRQMAVSGTPNRLIYSDQHRCLVCASQRYLQTRRGFRIIQPVVDFIPSRSNVSVLTHEVDSLDKIYALLEWSWTDENGKTYSFILAGGSYTKPSGSQRGRITFLQPTLKGTAQDIRATEAKIFPFQDPVYAFALDDKKTRLFVCFGRYVIVWRFHSDERKWKPASLPHPLRSPGIYVTWSADNDSLQVSTMQDGLISLDIEDVAGAEYDIKLKEFSMMSRAENSLSHVALTNTDGDKTMENGTVVMGTKDGRLLGLQPGATTGLQADSQTQVLFEAVLPRSLTRLRKSDIRPRWKPSRPPGIGGFAGDDIIGCSTDGAIIGLSFLDKHLWRRLSWLQRLCEWSPKLSPFSYQDPPYSVSEHINWRYAWPMPVGFSEQRQDDTELRTDEVADVEVAAPNPPQNIMMRTWKTKPQSQHIDGDVLGRLLRERDPVETLREILAEVAELGRDDPVAKWVREHREQELQCVEEAITLLRRVLDDWL